MAVFNFDVVGRFIDMLSGPIGRAIAALNGLTGASRRAAAAGGGVTAASTIRQIQGHTAAMNRHIRTLGRLTEAQRANYRGQTAEMLRYSRAQRLIEQRQLRINQAFERAPFNRYGNARHYGGGGGGFGQRFGRVHSGWSDLQHSAAALGGYGYALGRGGLGTLGIVGGMVGGYSSWKQFATFETAMANVRKAANLTRPEMDELGRSIRDVAIEMATPAEEVAGMAEQWALAGARGPELLKAMARQTAKAKLVWSGADSETISNTMAKMYSLWYKDIRDPGKMEDKVSSVIDAIDYLEDNFPTKAPEILKAFERFMPVAKGSGMTPEQVAAVATSLMISGPGSGERAGTRLAINWRRMEGLIDESIKKKGLKLSDTATPEVKKTMEQDTMLGIYKWMENLRVKFKGQKGWQKKAVGIIAKGLGFESAKNLEPLLADFGTTLQIGSIFNQGIARWATQMSWFRDRLKQLGPEGEQLLKTLDDFAKAMDGASGPWIGWASKSMAIQTDRAEYRTGRLMESVKKYFGTVGAVLDELFRDDIDHLSDVFQQQEERMNKLLKDTKEDRAKRSPVYKVPNLTGGWRDATKEEWEHYKDFERRYDAATSPDTAVGGVPPSMGGGWLNNLRRWIFGGGPDRFRFLTPGAPIALPPVGRFDFAGQTAQEAFGIGVPGTSISMPGGMPLPVRKPGPPTPPLPAPKPLSWPGGDSAPSIIYKDAPPIEIPAPQVKVNNNSPEVISVNVSVSPAFGALMRNPGTAAASGVQGETSGKTGVVK